MCIETDRQILKRGLQQQLSYLFGILRSTEITDQPIQNTSKWAGTVNIHIVGSIQCKIHTEVGRTIEQPHCITCKMPVWISLYWVNTHNGEKHICIPLLGFSHFISWDRLPPVEGAMVTTPIEWARMTPLVTLCPQHYTCGLLPPDFLLGGRH